MARAEEERGKLPPSTPRFQNIHAAVKNSLRGAGQVCRALLTAEESKLGSFQVRAPWSGSVAGGDAGWGQRAAPGTRGSSRRCGRLGLPEASPSHAQAWELSPEPFPAPGRCSGGGGGGMGWRRSVPLRLLPSFPGFCYPWNASRLFGRCARRRGGNLLKLPGFPERRQLWGGMNGMFANRLIYGLLQAMHTIPLWKSAWEQLGKAAKARAG